MDIIDIEMPLYAHNNIMYIYYELHGYKWHYIDIMTLLHLAPHSSQPHIAEQYNVNK